MIAIAAMIHSAITFHGCLVTRRPSPENKPPPDRARPPRGPAGTSLFRFPVRLVMSRPLRLLVYPVAFLISRSLGSAWSHEQRMTDVTEAGRPAGLLGRPAGLLAGGGGAVAGEAAQLGG